MPVHRVDPQSAGPQQPEPDDVGGPEAIARLNRQAEEFGEYVRHYLAAQGDSWLVTLRSAALWLVAALVALTVLTAVLATAAVIAVLGVADLTAQALGERTWAGYLLTGCGILTLTAILVLGAIVILGRRFRQGTVNKYAKRHRQQRVRFGHDAAEQAAAAHAERN